MALRMSEQPRTITIYNLLAGTNEFILNTARRRDMVSGD